MLRRNLTILALFFGCALGMRAQYDPSFSHYWAMQTAYNPAAAGKQDKINVVVGYNMSMVGFEHNPRTMYLSGDMPFYALGAYHGVGLQMINDDIGVFSHKQFSGHQLETASDSIDQGLSLARLFPSSPHPIHTSDTYYASHKPSIAQRFSGILP